MKRASGGLAIAAVAAFVLTTALVAPTGATTVQPLTGVRSVTSGFENSCALLASGKVDCWGKGENGQLGNGTFYTTGNQGSAVPVAVKGVGGSGTLADVASLTSDGNGGYDGYDGYCALLTSGKVDCWGYGKEGQLGNGAFYRTGNPGSAVPVVVKGVGGTGTLDGVASLTSNGNGGNDADDGFCALLTSGKVDCWGYGDNGQLGNGTFYTTGNDGSAVPVAVKGVGGTGTLGGVANLASDGDNFCARLTSGKVDCWGAGGVGDLGDGLLYSASPYGSAVPVAVDGVGYVGTLDGVASLATHSGSGSGYCALLTSGQVDCWGQGFYGQLGNGTFYTGSICCGSAVPVAVEGGSETGTLDGVASLKGGYDGYCALLTSGTVDCWGQGESGELGNGTFYTGLYTGSASPVAVERVGYTGTLDGVANLASDGDGYCARLTSGKVDCWGPGGGGELGNGAFYTTDNPGSAFPVAVKGVSGTGALNGAASLASDAHGYCARLTSGQVDCWGYGGNGELGNGTFYTPSPYGSAVPVAVVAPVGPGTASLTYSGVLNGHLVNAVSSCQPQPQPNTESEITVNGTLNGTPWVLLIESYDGETGVYAVISGRAGGGTGLIGSGYGIVATYPATVSGVTHIDWATGATLDVRLASGPGQSPAGNVEVQGTVTCG